MTRFLQLHFLTSFAASNLNRDDSGSPKNIRIGNTKRLRISSQSLKRAWRTSDTFQQALGGNIGTRTRRLGIKIYEDLIAGGIDEKNAEEIAIKIVGVFTDNEDKKENKLETKQLFHISPQELQSVNALVAEICASKATPKNDDERYKLLRKEHTAADIAAFGRMFASNPEKNSDAAVQVAHAFTVHPATEEDDYFTAVDDLKSKEQSGSGFLGVAYLGAGVYYSYICVDMPLLLENLGGNLDLAERTITALIECASTVAPTGKQNSHASRAYAHYILAEAGHQVPRQLSLAFVQPITSATVVEDSIKALETTEGAFEKMYGACRNAFARANFVQQEGSLNEIKNFAQEHIRAVHGATKG
ncbi:MAG: type I-E CRISPR-associated protein Cas7/Cse4/CasC [Candidatus Kapabacteria bacterium]|jgi:CRISPR system Cascade subunit CasC|nr:type I-E CRISPR-associated protein Cas7/Cse4/CasC [Candidatus Kapabacteria bacterium]